MHVGADDRNPTAVPVLIPQPLEDPLRGVLRFRRPTLILLQDPINHPAEGIQLRPYRRPAPSITRWHRERQHLRHRPRVDPEPPRRLPPAQPLHIHRASYLPVEFHAFHPPPSAPPGKRPSTATRLRQHTRDFRSGA